MPLPPPPIVGLSLNVPIVRSQDLIERVTLADRLGYDLFSVQDHPYNAGAHEAYGALAFALGRAESIAGYVGVTNLPLRPAPVLARTLATLSSLSGGRVVLGLGSGGSWDWISRFGVDRLTPADAVSAFEEAILLIKALTGGGGPVTFEGRFYRVDSVQPARVATPPIWTGSGGPRALRITGRLADGWIPPLGSDWLSERYQRSRPIIDQAARDAGRDPSQIIDYFNFGGVLTPRDLSNTRNYEGRWQGGSARQWITELTSAVREHGAGGFNTTVTNAEGVADLGTLRRFAEEVMPGIREAAR
jgi:alkanesulfonate monooxygenase SsuD/methylene tetrahydromethanopterin reductase-like flavin-dependent oxidoreductase (luciferase family)